MVTLGGRLEDELKYYNSIRNELIGRAKGEYALISGNTLTGTYASKTDAIRRGYELYGNKPFLVKKIAEVEESIHFTSALIVPA